MIGKCHNVHQQKRPGGGYGFTESGYCEKWAASNPWQKIRVCATCRWWELAKK